jgi:hypothetical protein
MPSPRSTRGPAYCDAHRFAIRMAGDAASPFGSVVTGSCSSEQRTSHGIAHSIICLGFAVMSGGLPGDRSPGGQFYLPDKEFRWICYLDLLLSTGGSDISADLPTSPQGPDHLFTSISHEVVGVWSLRILRYLEGLR